MNRKVLFLSVIATSFASHSLVSAQKTSTQKTTTPVTSKTRLEATYKTQGVWPGEGPMKWAPRPTEYAITANDLRTRLYQISDDSMQGRRIGELGNYKTTTYIANEFKRLGLKPAGDNGTYFQILSFGTNVIAADKSSLTISGNRLTPGDDWIAMVSSAGNSLSGTAQINNVPTVFAGRWGDTATALDASAIRGKVAVFAPPTVAAGAGGGRVPGANGQFTGIRDTRAARAGAVAVLVASLDQMNNGRNNTFRPRIGMQSASVDGPAAAAITMAVAQQIFGGPLNNVAVGAAGAPVSATWADEFTLSKYPARNVVAMLPGSDPTRATEYVLVGAHNDHEGVNARAVDHDSVRSFNTIMRPQGANDCRNPCVPTADQQRQIDSLIAFARKIRKPRRDSTMNGADDDGSGTVVMMEVAEKFSKEHPARSIIFISHQGEEAGLLGSKWFVDHPTIPLDSIVAAHNMDMVGKGHVYDVKFGGPNSVQTLGSRRLSREFGDIIDSVNAVIDNPMALDKSWDVPANPLNRFCRSDQVNYVHAGVPVTYFSFGYARDYHQVTDEPQYVDYDHAARMGNFMHDIMTAIANRHDKPAIAGPDPTMPVCR